MNITETYFGFTDNKKPMQKARMEKTLDKLIRHEGKVITQKQFIYNKLQEGCNPEIVEDYSYYSPKLEGMTKPKTLYKLVEVDRTYYELTKTEHDFSLHIINNGFLDTEKAAQFIRTEQEQQAEAERLQREKEEQERKEREELQAKEKAEREAKRQEKLKEWQGIGEQLVTDEIKNTITEVINKHWDTMKDRVNRDITEVINSMINNLPQFLGNYEYVQSHVKWIITDELNKDNLSNIINKEIYMSIFNITESDPTRTITAKIKAFYEGREYKGGVSKPVITDTFYIYRRNEGFVETEGQKKTIEGYTCFVHKENDIWTVTEAKTGMAISRNANKKESLEKAKINIIKNKETLESNIQFSINKYGISPLYRGRESA